ncbi:hypothetical protein NNJEOMEG_03323 [Fundidesulfovibrio magnetotacticus]|uniref:Helix-turn-helix domain-containing protein n=1 Tax=Fundidesulfovibrio magnetotacticus TaxID=2730080 RepID=A0A6V8LX42_9BACT|nr:helix-turn-helix domain-containing protein [Fundidesulfovibrio magnetotacticus]GFK95460.1 hypothetical protein NNJEOMEG_03323 [Fundidesulfovibrio magnetotacticus]
MSNTNLPYDRAAEGKPLTVPEVKERLNCSRSFVYKLINRRELKVIRLGDKKGIRVPERSVNRYLKRRANMVLKDMEIPLCGDRH